MSLTQEEMRIALEALKFWPKERQEELFVLQPNEREMAMLLAAYFNARPT